MIRATATAVPRYEYSQEEVLEQVERWLGPLAERFSRVLGCFSGSRGLVRRRRSVIPIEEVFSAQPLQEKNAAYRRGMIELGEKAVRDCLERADRAPDGVDYFISSSCTGFMIPSLDAVLAHRLGMRSDLGRLPITGHGCAGGAVALRQAREHLLAHPGHTVLVLAAEAPSVTFQQSDRTGENIVSTALFGDGAAAVLLSSEDPEEDEEDPAPRILAAHSRMFPASEALMGFELRDTGFKIVLSKQVPAAVREHAPPAIRDFLCSCGIQLSGIDHFLLHPGGRKIIEGFEQVFDLHANELEPTRRVLAEHGNLSSATVLFILDDLLRSGRAARHDFGLLVAFGPGFGCETLLLRWGARSSPSARAGAQVQDAIHRDRIEVGSGQ